MKNFVKAVLRLFVRDTECVLVGFSVNGVTYNLVNDYTYAMRTASWEEAEVVAAKFRHRGRTVEVLEDNCEMSGVVVTEANGRVRYVMRETAMAGM